MQYLHFLLLLTFWPSKKKVNSLRLICIVWVACFATHANCQVSDSGVGYRPKTGITISHYFTGAPMVHVSKRRLPYCDVDLLFDQYIQSELELSTKTKEGIEAKKKEYQDVALSCATDGLVTQTNVSESASIRIDPVRKRIRELLSRTDRKKLEDLDKYLFFRRVGLKAYVSKLNPNDSDLIDTEILSRELQVWKNAAESSARLWRSSLEEIGEVLPDKIKEEFKNRIEYFDSPFCADVTIFYLDHMDEAEEFLVDIDGEDAYKKMLGRRIQFELEMDGSWRPRKVVNLEVFFSNMNFFVACLNQEHIKTGRNELGILDSQFSAIEQLNIEYNTERRESYREMKEIGETVETMKAHKNRCEVHSIEMHDEIWESVLLPFQKAGLLEIVRNRDEIIIGPISVLSNDELKEKDKQKVVNILERFGRELETIELDSINDILQLSSQNNIELMMSSKSRPKYLKPCWTLMHIKSKNE